MNVTCLQMSIHTCHMQSFSGLGIFGFGLVNVPQQCMRRVGGVSRGHEEEEGPCTGGAGGRGCPRA